MRSLTRRDLLSLVSSAAPALWFSRAAWAQEAPKLELQPLGDKLWFLYGAGCNITVLQGPDGMLLVDSGIPANAEVTEAKARSIASLPVRMLINTHYHYDHVGGNVRLGGAGAKIMAHANVLKRVSTPQRNAFFGQEWPAIDEPGRPKDTFTAGGKLDFGAEKIVYQPVTPAHTDGDTTVHFTNANVFATGDLMFLTGYPFIDYTAGGSIEGMIAAADKMLKMVDSQTRIVPGHGPVSKAADLKAFRDMLAGINDNVNKLIKAGKTLDQVLAAEPTKAWDPNWSAFFKPAEFVRLLHHGKTNAAK